MSKASHSVGHIGSALDWSWENLQFLRMRMQGLKNKEAELGGLLGELDGYRSLYESLTGRSFQQASIFEVGYGARPLRLLALSSLGLNARGIDLDAPSLEGSLHELWRILKTNGWLRFIKSMVRTTVFDAHERRALDRTLARRGARLRVLPDRFLVGDVADVALAPASLDFIYSEDVFEHIPREALDRVCASLAQALAPQGVALISPAVFTGIGGGHLVEWYPDTLGRDIDRRSEPWEHLRQRRYTPDCFLNEMRLYEYQRLFERHFTVEAVHNLQAGHGHAFLTEEVREDLNDYSMEELLGDKWRFVLRTKREEPA
ncbi:class I SAM-dependent methyltransferase [Hydrogenophaga sp. PBL-H3]|uniref:class I SAM-dependent methyltransferase n=1 Tax=Hydrogenophaga sp. PBL-H3 TaxID=434010 RepID=UPI00131FDF29|nr:class I SAM-dependent methyltransferase [Hydrogenophaga sp. PBL-H3]QHE75920.1 class I SAM-dependent methyltransferase [Hydrogenophaga sp. PBL-H3]QHE80344.1 class I SAM-dependent methyltransferase [Hydrogenophaga sp. PBL-H3]